MEELVHVWRSEHIKFQSFLPSGTGSYCSLPYINRLSDPQASEGSSVSTTQPALGCGIINGAPSYFTHAQGIQA